jgi:hypothetical protein
MPATPALGQFEDMLRAARPALRPGCESLRGLIAGMHGGFVELVWPRQGIASYGVGPKKMSQHDAYIAAQGSHINLGLYRGAASYAEPHTPAMTPEPIARWHQIVQHRDMAALALLLADDVVFHSPVVHAPQAGKAITLQYLGAALRVFGCDSFRYVRELMAERDAVLEFELELEGVRINGVDMIRWDESGRIVEFKVMLRPLKAINLIHQKMAAMLQERSK